MNDAASVSDKKTHVFQAEVSQVLDIVIHSLYTHREIFLRELISNAADALEKFRYHSLQTQDFADPDLPLQITIEANEEAKTITITDTGIGMNEAEMIEHLGTIAHSGSREFLQKLKEAASSDVQLIGKFGVGFYSSFMVAKRVVVQSRSWRRDDPGMEWTSEGIGEYTTAPCGGLSRGTRITLELRDDAHEFASEDRLKSIIRQYSNFVPFPIQIGDETVNSVQAIWTRNKKDISDEDYNEFYKFIANDPGDPKFRLHFSSDAPLQLHALLYLPATNIEKMGLGKTDPGVSLYCRKVLIQDKAESLVPDWLRFVKGVVDSEDLPLNISRETLQDNALVRKLGTVLTKRVLKFLSETAQKDPSAYDEFFREFGLFIKEGITTDFEYRNDLSKLLRFETSSGEAGKLVSLADYVSRMGSEQEKIYFTSGANRASIEASPYMEAFRAHHIEVIYLYETVDEFVLNHVREFEGKSIVSADQADLDLPDSTTDDKDEAGDAGLNKDQAETFAGWLKTVLGDRVGAVRESKRLVDSPAMLVNPDQFMTTGMQRVMQSMNNEFNRATTMNLEFNPGHPIVTELARRHSENADDPLLSLAAEHLFDSAQLSAGIEADPQQIARRNHAVLQKALGV